MNENMRPIDAITSEEKALIRNYIAEHSGADRSNIAFIDHILRIWNAEKDEYLWKLFGEKLIISTPIEYSMSHDQLWDAMSDNGLFNTIFWREINTLYSHEGDTKASYALHRLLNTVNLATNTCQKYYTWCDDYGDDGKDYIPLPLADGKIYKVFRETKLMKLLRKLAESYQLEGFEEFCLLHSQSLNQKKLSGELCLSIHPMDYMTMSDNDCDWSSCMSWTENGDYRQGTVEMMNSKCTIVAYLKSSDPYRATCDGYWNNKKWRSLIIVDPDFAVSVKGYPYNNDSLAQVALKKIAEIANWDVAPEAYNEQKILTAKSGKTFHANFVTWDHAMYNDFNNNHWAIVRPDLEENLDYSRRDGAYNYCGESECMECGGIEGIGEDYGTYNLCCDYCYPVNRCDECGCIVGDDYCIFDGRYVCGDCYDDLCAERDED